MSQEGTSDRQAENLPDADSAGLAAALAALPEAISALSSALAGPLVASLKEAGVLGRHTESPHDLYGSHVLVAGPSGRAGPGPGAFYSVPGSYARRRASPVPLA